jgi:hypothetical protein
MLKDLSGQSDEPELEQRSETGGDETNRDCAQFRALLWLGIAADIRGERASREIKGCMPC